jgi:hypothetical protein
MLRASAESSNTDIDLHLVNGVASDNRSIEYSNELMAFATAIASRDEAELIESREKLLAASNAEVVVDAAAVAGNFQRMVRIADSTGIPVDDARMELAQPTVDLLELRRFKTSEHTPI